MRLRHHRAVQRQEQTISATVSEQFAKPFRDFVEDGVGDRTGRRRPRHEQRHRLEALDARCLEEAADLVMRRRAIRRAVAYP